MTSYIFIIYYLLFHLCASHYQRWCFISLVDIQNSSVYILCNSHKNNNDCSINIKYIAYAIPSIHTKSIICCIFNPFNVFAGTFWLYAGLAFVGVIIIGFTLPETKGRSLEEVEGLFARPWCGTAGSTIDYNTNTIQYVHIRGLNRDGRESELESPE